VEIDVIINSCARPEILDVSVKTFMERVKTKHNLRYVILEDKVLDEKRQEEGRSWIEKHADMFDKIVYAKKKMGPGFFFAPAVYLCKSKYFFHLEDDNEFIVGVDIDPLIDLLEEHDDFVEIMMSRGKINPLNNPRRLEIGGIKLTESDLFSVATGVFNTELVHKLIDKVGWGEQLHEAALLKPASMELGFRKFVLGHNELHYVHVGAEKGYRKGGYKNG
jgi:hypothetical protein